MNKCSKMLKLAGFSVTTSSPKVAPNPTGNLEDQELPSEVALSPRTFILEAMVV